jgi:hypothetical protein
LTKSEHCMVSMHTDRQSYPSSPTSFFSIFLLNSDVELKDLPTQKRERQRDRERKKTLRWCGSSSAPRHTQDGQNPTWFFLPFRFFQERQTVFRSSSITPRRITLLRKNFPCSAIVERETRSGCTFHLYSVSIHSHPTPMWSVADRNRVRGSCFAIHTLYTRGPVVFASKSRVVVVVAYNKICYRILHPKRRVSKNITRQTSWKSVWVLTKVESWQQQQPTNQRKKNEINFWNGIPESEEKKK